MKNIFNKTNAPYLVAGALATLALISSGVVGVLTAVAVFNASLPLIAGLVDLAVFSAATVALSAVVISKNKTVSQQEKFESRVAQRKQEEKNARAELKASGLLSDVIALPEISRQENFSNRMAQRKQEEEKERAELKAKGLLPDIIAPPYKDPEISSPESQPAEKEETKVSGYFNQVVSTVNWLTSQATKAMPYLAASYLPYVFYNYATTPVSASFDDVNITKSFVTNSSITSPVL